MPLILTNVNLIDCVNEGVTPDASVVIDDDRIVEVGASGATPPSSAVIDLRGAFLLPGLWDVHVHPEYPVPPGDDRGPGDGELWPGAFPSPHRGRRHRRALWRRGLTSWTLPGSGPSTPATWLAPGCSPRATS